jgi:hypothetical protein
VPQALQTLVRVTHPDYKPLMGDTINTNKEAKREDDGGKEDHAPLPSFQIQSGIHFYTHR